MSTKMRLILLISLFLIFSRASAAVPGSMETSGALTQIIAFLLGMCGSIYLAAILWERGNKGSESWKHLSIAMVLFGFWNILMIFDVMLTSINGQDNKIAHESFDMFSVFAILSSLSIEELNE